MINLYLSVCLLLLQFTSGQQQTSSSCELNPQDILQQNCGLQEAQINKQIEDPISEQDQLSPEENLKEQSPKKIAFLFLLYNDLPQEFVWREYFKNVDKNLYSLYYHQKHYLPLNFFKKRKALQVPTVPTDYMAIGLWQAMNQLLWYAYHDELNTKFIFVSQACIPIIPFNQLYDEIISNNNSYFQTGEYAFPRLSFLLNIMPEEKILKHHQWIILDRQHASYFVNDEDKVLNTFTSLLEDPYGYEWVPDECVYGTYLKYIGKDDEIIDQCVTFTDWSLQIAPREFHYLNEGLIDHMRSQKCFFGRKFALDEDRVSHFIVKRLVNPKFQHTFRRQQENQSLNSKQ